MSVFYSWFLLHCWILVDRLSRCGLLHRFFSMVGCLVRGGRVYPIRKVGRDSRATIGFACQGESVGVSQRSEEHTSELQSLMRISYAVFCLQKKKHPQPCP